MLVSGICQKILVERLDKFPEPIGKGYLSSLLQAWYISIIPPNIFSYKHGIQLTLIVSNSVDSNFRLSRIFIKVPNFVVYKYI